MEWLRDRNRSDCFMLQRLVLEYAYAAWRFCGSAAESSSAASRARRGRPRLLRWLFFDRLGLDGADLSQCTLWHNGGTGGYASYMGFSRRDRIGVVLLANSDHQPD